MRKLLSLLMIIAFSIGLVACGDEDVNEVEKDKSENQTEVEFNDAEKVEIENKEREEERRAKAEQEARENEIMLLEDKALELMEDNLGDIADIEFNRDEKLFSINMTNDEVIHELAMVFSGELSIDNWHGLVDSMQEMASSINSLLGGGYTVELLNPSNANRSLLVIYDGEVSYDVADDL